MWPDVTQSMLLPESSCVYIPSSRSVCGRVFLDKIPFFWGGGGLFLVTMVTNFRNF